MKRPVLEQIGGAKRLQLLVEAVTDYAIYLLDLEGNVVSWNAGARRIKGYTADEIIGQNFSKFFTEEDRASGKPARALELAKTVGRFEDEAWRVRKDGTRFWASAVLEAVRDEDGSVIGFAKVTRDLTERRAAQQALEHSERQFRLLVNGVIDYAIFMLDPQGQIASWNSGAERLKGYTYGEIVGQNFSRFYTEEDHAAGLPQKLLSIARNKGKVATEGWRVRKDGTRFWASVVIDAIHDETGQLVGFAKVTRDLTEQRESELKLDEAREQLFQAQKMEAIGQLTGGVAHDFNNLLTVIISGADLAERHIKDNERLKRLIGNMRHAAMRGERLTKQLLAFSRRQPLKPESIDVAQHLNTFIEMLAHSLRGDIRIVSDVPTNLLPHVRVDVGQLELALLNIGLNARDAMPEGGTLTIRARKHGGGQQGKGSVYVVVDIIDTGIGMSSEVQARAFEPFFTTKDIGLGSGLGLSQAYGFAKQSGGALTLESAPGKGTKVSLHLPTASDNDNRLSLDPPASRPREAGSATVLLVEDDNGVSELALGLLQDAGYKVKIAGTAAEALQVLRNGEQIDLVFSDIMMPGGMNGAELARIVRGEFPSIFILLATGYAEAAANAATQEFPLIRKPYGREMLLDKVGEILGEVV
jgi:PAS domain S-box-containing protein